MTPESIPVINYALIAFQYLGVFSGYAGVLAVLIFLLVAFIQLVSIPVINARERRDQKRMFGFLDLFDENAETERELVQEAFKAGRSAVYHLRRPGRPYSGITSGEEDAIEAGVKAVLTHIERRMHTAKAKRLERKSSARSAGLLALHRRLQARKALIAAREKELGVEVPWQLKL